MTERVIDLISPLREIANHGLSAKRLPAEASVFKKRLEVELLASSGEWVALFGGHRNFVIRHKNPSQEEDVRIYWRSHEMRWPAILKALLVEHIVSTEFDIPGRHLLNPLEPVEVSPEGYLMTRLRYVYGEGRYPWLSEEIQSASRMLGRLHDALACIRFNNKEPKQLSMQDGQYIHGDFGRQNVLFQSETAHAYAVIDYENIRLGSRSEDIARTVSLLLVDTKLRNQDGSLYTPEFVSHELFRQFHDRMTAVLDTYPDQSVNIDEILVYVRSYLELEDYGGLNQVRQFAVEFLNNLKK